MGWRSVHRHGRVRTNPRLHQAFAPHSVHGAHDVGTDLPGLGFNVAYKRQEQGVWFPATFGTEFRIHAVFFINRDVSIALENADFERTQVKSTMKVVGPAD